MKTARKPKAAEDKLKTAITMLPVEQLHPNAYNPNRMTDEEFAELVNEVQHLGRIPKPAVVRKLGDNFVIVDGEHGWRSAKEVGLPELPCEIIEADDFECMRQNYKRNQHGKHNLVLLGQMFQAMMADRNLSLRELAKEVQVSEGTIRNASQYTDAFKLRNSYAPDKAMGQVSKLSIRQVRLYLRFPPSVAQLWLDSGANTKTFEKKIIEFNDALDYDEREELGFCLDFYVRKLGQLEKTGLFQFVGKVRSEDAFHKAIKKVQEWHRWEQGWGQAGVPAETLRLYAVHFYGECWYVRHSSYMDYAIEGILDTTLKPPAFALTPEEFTSVVKKTQQDFKRASHRDFCDRLTLEVIKKRGKPIESKHRIQRELQLEKLKDAPDYIRNSKLTPDQKAELWKFKAPEDFKREMVRRRWGETQTDEEKLYSGGAYWLTERLHEWNQDRELRETWNNSTNEQLACWIAQRFIIYDEEKEKDLLALKTLRDKLATLTKAELIFLMSHTQNMEHLHRLGASISRFMGRD